MKTRQAFVANSSSSSFLILLSDLTHSQITKLKEYKHYSKDMENVGYKDNLWYVYQTETHIEGNTVMNNFDMEQYMINIGIDVSKVEWDEY